MPEDAEARLAIEAKIRQRRFQMVVHSYMYYKMDDPMISDDKWQQWANELRDLQIAYPGCCEIGLWDDDFRHWDGSTGMHLDQTGALREYAEYIHRLYQKHQDTINTEDN